MNGIGFTICIAGTEISGADASYPQVFQQQLLPLMAQHRQWWPEANTYVLRAIAHSYRSLHCTR
jgi:hypothetical protein